jgi:hypothetical protein
MEGEGKIWILKSIFIDAIFTNSHNETKTQFTMNYKLSAVGCVQCAIVKPYVLISIAALEADVAENISAAVTHLYIMENNYDIQLCNCRFFVRNWWCHVLQATNCFCL